MKSQSQKFISRCWIFLTVLLAFGQINAQSCPECYAGSASGPLAQPLDDCRVVFTALGSLNPAAGCTVVDYEWDFGDNNTATTPNSAVEHTFTGPGPFTVCVRRNLLDGAGQPCTVVSCTTITLPNCSDPCDNCNINIAGWNSFEPSDCSIGLGLTQVGATGNCAIVDFTWDWGDTQVETGQTSTEIHEYDNPGTYTVCVTANASVQGSAQMCTEVICTTITVGECIDPCDDCAITLTGWNYFEPTECVRGLGLTGIATNGNCSIDDFTWDWGDTQVETGQTSTEFHEYANPGTYTVCVTANASLEGSAEMCTEVICTTITVGECVDPCEDCYLVQPSDPKVTIFGDCQVLIQATGTLGDETGCTELGYFFEFGDGQTLQTGPTYAGTGHTYNGPGPYEVCVTRQMLDATGAPCNIRTCTTITLPNCTYVDPCIDCNLTLSGWNYNAPTDCQRWLQIQSVSTGQNCDIVDYTWDWGDMTVESGQTSGELHQYNAPGTYEVCVTVTAEVQGSAEMCVEKICTTITVATCVDPCITCAPWISTPTVYSFGGCLYGFSASGGANNPCTGRYSWDFGDGNGSTNGNAFQWYSYEYDGTYDVCVTYQASNPAGDVCEVTSCTTITVTNCGMMKAALAAKEFTAHPNPTRAGTTLKVNVTKDIEQLELIDLTGRIILKHPVNGQGEYQVDLPANLSKGIYFLRSANGELGPIRIMVGNQ